MAARQQNISLSFLVSNTSRIFIWYMNFICCLGLGEKLSFSALTRAVQCSHLEMMELCSVPIQLAWPKELNAHGQRSPCLLSALSSTTVNVCCTESFITVTLYNNDSTNLENMDWSMSHRPEQLRSTDEEKNKEEVMHGQTWLKFI